MGVGVFGVDALGALTVGAHELVRLNLFLHLDRSRALSAACIGTIECDMHDCNNRSG